VESVDAKSGTANTIKFREAQKKLILKLGPIDMSVLEICRRAAIGQSTYHNWKNKYDGLLPAEIKPL